MKTVIGLLLCTAAVVFGLWAGVWWAFIGGIVDVVNQVRAEHVSALTIAIGVAKVVFAGVIGWAAFAVLFVPGYAMVSD